MTQITQFRNASCIFFFLFEDGRKLSNRSGSGYGKRYGVGDTVFSVHLDIDSRVLSFSVNDIAQGQAYDAAVIPVGKEWRLAVTLLGSHVTVLSCGEFLSMKTAPRTKDLIRSCSPSACAQVRVC